jgi:hypothetical protein
MTAAHAMTDDDRLEQPQKKRACIESRDPFALSACCWYIDQQAESSDDFVVCVTNARDPDARILKMARGAGAVRWGTENVEYDLYESQPLGSDGKPEPFRRLSIVSDNPVAFVEAALAAYRHELYLKTPQNGSVPQWVWDDDAACWMRRRALPRRGMDTLFLDASTEWFLDDVRHFVSPANQAQYAALHVAPVRVYMLAGRAGAGKSSLIHCAASELGFGVCRVDADARVEDASVAVPPRAFLVIEDVDCAFAGRQGQGSSPFSKLLAALDSSGTAGEPVVVVLTTNHLSKLDHALRRRIDRVLTFGNATKAQCEAMFRHFGFAATAFGPVWEHATESGRRSFSTSTFHKFLVKCLATKDPVACLGAFDELAACVDECSDSHASMFS